MKASGLTRGELGEIGAGRRDPARRAAPGRRVRLREGAVDAHADELKRASASDARPRAPRRPCRRPHPPPRRRPRRPGHVAGPAGAVHERAWRRTSRSTRRRSALGDRGGGGPEGGQHGDDDGDRRHLEPHPDGRLQAGSSVRIDPPRGRRHRCGGRHRGGARSGGAGSVAAARPAGGARGPRRRAGWVTWWRRDAAPARWAGEAPLGGRVAWRAGAAAWSGASFSSAARARHGARGSWSCGSIPAGSTSRWRPPSPGAGSGPSATADAGAALALDAGQFRAALPWGWVVAAAGRCSRRSTRRSPGRSWWIRTGAVRVVAPDSVAAERARGTAREAFQSYPMLLEDGVVPAPLRAGRGVDLEHRDAPARARHAGRGRVIVALTRFDALGTALGRVPFGLTSPEMAAVMGALGCRQALLLDGGSRASCWCATRGRPAHLARHAERAARAGRQGPAISIGR